MANIYQNNENCNINTLDEVLIRKVKVLKRHNTYIIIDIDTNKVIKNLPVRSKSGVSVRKYVFDNSLFVVDFGKVLTNGIKWGFNDKWGLVSETLEQFEDRGYYDGARYIKK